MLSPFYQAIFYTCKPIIPRRVQILLRRIIVQYRAKRFQHIWPIDPQAGKLPPQWPGWPNGRKFALVLSHDVDTQKGHDQCQKLADIEIEMGFRSAFNFVPERYKVSDKLRVELTTAGFEICVHGLKHDGKLFRSYREFKRRAKFINQYIAAWNVKGFTSPSMHHNLNWMHHLDISHCTSTFDTDPFEPQPDGVGTIFPFWVNNHEAGKGYVEIPYTLPQDFTLFILMGERSNAIWKTKLDWIAQKGGMAFLNCHPDYMNFNGGPLGREEYPVELYVNFLRYLKERYGDCYYHARPLEIARFLNSTRPLDAANRA